MNSRNAQLPRDTGVWPAALALTTLIGSLAVACMMPFVGVAVVAAATIPRSRALLTVGTLWLANQLIGFTLLGYPTTGYSLAWGVAIGVAAMLALYGAQRMMATDRDARHIVSAFALSFLVFEGVLLLFALVVGGTETFTPAIVGAIFLNDALWCAGLFLLREMLSRTLPQLFNSKALASTK